MKIGFLGSGNMASAIIKGLVKSKFIKPTNIFAFDIEKSTLNNLVKCTGITPCTSNEEVVLNCDFIVLAVKPNQIAKVVSTLNFNGKVVISIAGGTKIEQIQSMLTNGINIPVVRVMPNVNVEVLAGITAICASTNVKEDDLNFVLDVFNAVGETVQISEEAFGTFTAIAGSSPAFTYLYIDSLARAALKNGMSKDEATKIAAQAVLGSAKTILETKQAPWVLIDKVCSPGGTTIAGICELENHKFIATVVKGVEAVINADKIMESKQG